MDQIQALGENWAEMGQQLLPQLPPLQPSLLHNSRMTSHYRRRSIPTSLMVNTAIKSQLRGPRDSVSFVAIKKYIALNYRASVQDVEARLRLVKRYVLNALASGKLVRTKGTGVSGSFRLPQKQRTQRAPMKKVAKKKPTKSKVNAIRKQMGKQLKNMTADSIGVDSAAGAANAADEFVGGGQLVRTTSGQNIRRPKNNNKSWRETSKPGRKAKSLAAREDASK